MFMITHTHRCARGWLRYNARRHGTCTWCSSEWERDTRAAFSIAAASQAEILTGFRPQCLRPTLHTKSLHYFQRACRGTTHPPVTNRG